MCSIAPPYQNLLGRLVELTSQQHLEGCFEVRIGPISVSECPWKHHRAVRPMVRGVSALNKHIHWPWKANRRVYHSRAGLWSSIFACQMRCFEVQSGRSRSQSAPGSIIVRCVRWSEESQHSASIYTGPGKPIDVFITPGPGSGARYLHAR